MKNFYRVLYADDASGVAYSAEASDLFFLPYEGVVAEWTPMMLELRDGPFSDYLASDVGCRLCSEHLMGILQRHASKDDELQWLPVEVRSGDEIRPYFILHFPFPPEVLDLSASLLARDFVVKPVLSAHAVGSHQVFAYPKAGQHRLFVGEAVKHAIDAAGCTGLEFSRAPIR